MSSSFRVLYVSSFGDFHGGGQHSLNLLIQDIMKAGITPIVAAPEEGDFLAHLRDSGIETRVFALPSLRRARLISTARTVGKIRQFLKEYDIHLIHAEGPRAVIIYGRAAHALGIPFVFHVRVSTPEPSWYERLVVSYADAVICVSIETAQRFSWHHGNKIHVIPNGVDLDLFRPGVNPDPAVRALRTGERDVLIGEVAYIIPPKGQDTLISAAAALKPESLKRLKLLFIGDGVLEYVQQLHRETSRLDLSGNISFLGYVDEIQPILAGLDVVALPSQTEGLPRALLEAAAMHLPLIASDIPGCRELVVDGENGYLCPVGDVAAWAHALERMIQEADRNDMGRKSRTLVEGQFDVHDVSQRVLKVYKNLLDERRR